MKKNLFWLFGKLEWLNYKHFPHHNKKKRIIYCLID